VRRGAQLPEHVSSFTISRPEIAVSPIVAVPAEGPLRMRQWPEGRCSRGSKRGRVSRRSPQSAPASKLLCIFGRHREGPLDSVSPWLPAAVDQATPVEVGGRQARPRAKPTPKQVPGAPDSCKSETRV